MFVKNTKMNLQNHFSSLCKVFKQIRCWSFIVKKQKLKVQAKHAFPNSKQYKPVLSVIIFKFWTRIIGVLVIPINRDNNLNLINGLTEDQAVFSPNLIKPQIHLKKYPKILEKLMIKTKAKLLASVIVRFYHTMQPIKKAKMH